MKRWLTLSLVLGGSLFGFQAAVADDDDNGGSGGFGLGIGLVNLDNVLAVADDVELYYTANYRFAVGEERETGGGWQGYLEPEVGYWDGDLASDLLVGVNFVGVLPYGGVDFFVGAGPAIHFLDSDVTVNNVTVSESEEAFGVNAHFGVDVHLSDSVSVFGTGRFDIVDDTESLEARAFVGLRFGA
jgi:hypothetical protein